MFKDIKTGLRLMRYGLQFKTMVGFLAFFLIFGVIMEMMSGATVSNLGGLYMAISGIYLYQMVMTNSASAVVASSPVRRGLQTYVPIILSGFATLILFTVLTVIRLYRVNNVPEIAADPELQGALISSLVIIAFLIFIMFIYNAVAYKMYIVALIIFIPVIMVVCATGNAFNPVKYFPALANPVVSMVLSYGLIILGMFFGYLATLALYRKPLDEKTYKAAIARAGK